MRFSDLMGSGRSLPAASARAARALWPGTREDDAFLAGAAAETVVMVRRMCAPLHVAITQFFSAQAPELDTWICSELRHCRSLDEAVCRLARQLAVEFHTARTRLASDRPTLAARRMMNAADVVTRVRIASADKHDGQHVLRLALSASPALYYKPRPGAGAALLETAAAVLRTWQLDLGAARTVDRGSYHWMAEVAHDCVLTHRQAQRFAFNGGVLYGLASLLNASDLHFENIVAHRDRPVVVDCETLSQPRFSAAAAAYLLKRPHDANDDTTSLFMNLDEYDGEEIDYGGLSCTGFRYRQDPHAGAQVALQTDTRPLVRHHTRSAVVADGTRMAPAVACFDDFAAGLRAFCRVALVRHDEVLGALAPDALLRVPLRATRVYAALLSEQLAAISFSTYATPGWRQFLEDDARAAAPAFVPTAAVLMRKEQLQLAALDIPVAYVRAGSTACRIGDIDIDGIFDLAPRAMAARRIAALTADNVAARLAVLRARLPRVPA
jgi:lantibiotic modifying enzyme